MCDKMRCALVMILPTLRSLVVKKIPPSAIVSVVALPGLLALGAVALRTSPQASSVSDARLTHLQSGTLGGPSGETPSQTAPAEPEARDVSTHNEPNFDADAPLEGETEFWREADFWSENRATELPKAVSSTGEILVQPVAQTTARRQRLIRVGLSTQGGAISLMAPARVSVTDGEQPGRRLVASAGEIITFYFGPVSTLNAHGKTFSGPIFIRTSGGSYGAWRVCKVYVAGGPTRVSTNGESPRWSRPYRGAFEIAPQTFSFEREKHKSALRVVNIAPLDEYLKGVVPWEMKPTAPLEALKAQAICARSETLAKIEGGRHARDGFDICDYDHCQGYPGTENEKPASTRAVEETSGLVMFLGSRVADAVYFTNSGGITANKDDVWRGGPEPHLRSVVDASPTKHPETYLLLTGAKTEADWVKFCTQNLPSYAQPNQAEIEALAARRRREPAAARIFQPGDLPEFYRWTRVVSSTQMAQAASARAPMQSVSEVRVLDRSPSGRIKKLQIVGRNLGGQTVTATYEKDSQIRSMLSGRLGSTTALPSSLFVILPRREGNQITDWVFKGAGWGHGAGMCQRGAQNHAKQGWNARQIIRHYFHGVSVLNAY
jgi:peptidoglycan hydrolase-like amidase